MVSNVGSIDEAIRDSKINGMYSTPNYLQTTTVKKKKFQHAKYGLKYEVH